MSLESLSVILCHLYLTISPFLLKILQFFQNIRIIASITTSITDYSISTLLLYVLANTSNTPLMLSLPKPHLASGKEILFSRTAPRIKRLLMILLSL